MPLPPEAALFDLALTIGELPGGDTPAAWYASVTNEVLEAYQRYASDQRKWNDAYSTMLKEGNLPPACQFVTEGARGSFIGIVAPKGLDTPPRWFRRGKGGHLVPRQRTTAERTSKVRKLFHDLAAVPRALDYLPGMPKTLLVGEVAYAPVVRKPAQAVLVFLPVAPEAATEPFEVDGNWARLKLSAFHLLRERQKAAELVK